MYWVALFQQQLHNVSTRHTGGTQNECWRNCGRRHDEPRNKHEDGVDCEYNITRCEVGTKLHGLVKSKQIITLVSIGMSSRTSRRRGSSLEQQRTNEHFHLSCGTQKLYHGTRKNQDPVDHLPRISKDVLPVV